MSRVGQVVIVSDIHEEQEYELDPVFLQEVIEGLSTAQKTLPCKYFYDEKGSQLFEAICATPEYYITRTECSIYECYAKEMSALIGSKALLLEPGAGSVKKIAMILENLTDPVGFLPMDISREILQHSSELLSKRFPTISIEPIVMDFLNKQQIHDVFSGLPVFSVASKRVIFFPGSTIGNFDPSDAVSFLKQFADNLHAGDGLLIGVDLVKSPSILEAAYDDVRGVTAQFNKNLLVRIDRELNASFSDGSFSHRAVFNRHKSRIEMHLVSDLEQKIYLNDTVVRFDKGETIHTENSYKYTVDDFASLAKKAGFRHEKVWKDGKSLFSVHYFSVM